MASIAATSTSMDSIAVFTTHLSLCSTAKAASFCWSALPYLPPRGDIWRLTAQQSVGFKKQFVIPRSNQRLEKCVGLWSMAGIVAKRPSKIGGKLLTRWFPLSLFSRPMLAKHLTLSLLVHVMLRASSIFSMMHI
uniref:Uncharacterized protein n=1 Tax=Solanum lycopersicum TaxID=4081 RepID=K4AVQ4_SOLLC